MRKHLFSTTIVLALSMTLSHYPDAGTPPKTDGSVAAQEKGNREAQKVERVWREAVEKIRAQLNEALHRYKKGSPEKAKKVVIAAQFEGYKNSLLETAVRRHISQKKDFENNDGFSAVLKAINNGESAKQIENRIGSLIKSLEEDLPGLALVDGAVSEKSAERTRSKIPEKDWSKLSKEIAAAVGGAIEMYARGNTRQAVEMIKEIYYDNYDGSGFEAKIDSVDRTANEKLGARFSELVRLMQAGEPPERIRWLQRKTKADLENAVSKLAQRPPGSATGFFRSLREKLGSRE